MHATLGLLPCQLHQIIFKGNFLYYAF